jgi:spore germination protein YaaH
MTPAPADLAMASAPPDLATPPAARPLHTRCGWIDDPVAEASFVANAAQFNAIHPKWWTLDADAVTPDAAGHPDLASIVAAAQANNVRLLPLIDAADTSVLRNMINSPSLRAQHVANLVKLVHDHGYAGLDIDYEHLWNIADRPGYTAFMQALSTAFHAQGYELSMAITPVVQDDMNNGYDYNALAAACDTLHMMGYDFHWVGGSHLGPLAPLGWIDQSFAFAQTTGHGDRFMLGLANYAIGDNYFTSALDAASQCTSPPATTTTHMATCPYGNFDAGRALSCPTANHGTLWFEDVASMEQKIQAALKHGSRGVTYWTLGNELPGYFAMVKSYYP